MSQLTITDKTWIPLGLAATLITTIGGGCFWLGGLASARASDAATIHDLMQSKNHIEEVVDKMGQDIAAMKQEVKDIARSLRNR